MIEANGVDHIMLRMGDVGGRPGRDRCIYSSTRTGVGCS